MSRCGVAHATYHMGAGCGLATVCAEVCRRTGVAEWRKKTPLRRLLAEPIHLALH